MLQITEDTPPDMLSGAMDLTVHLPTGKAVKMAVERSTPMMDLLVQITAKHQMQLSNYTLQALGMAPSAQHSDTILPYKPNTPIGTLDTQHVKVVPKSRTLPVPKNIPPGHQPFESTFRLKVHLPRNQLYVTRVSRNVLLEDIMKEVCEEKNLNPSKYAFKHPGNFDEVLDPKLTLSDYQITEIYVVSKGAANLSQAFSSTDIMALRKEEERKQMHNKTGGGVFNLIFRRGKTSLGSGSISSENRSISPTQSDDSRSVTPPNAPQIVTSSPKKDPPLEKPKPPQRKRRPAPKPPIELVRRNSEEKPPSNVSEPSSEPTQQQQQQQQQVQMRKTENGLTICHSRNSSDSSGYHEASVLSENCHTSLPRRPKSAFVSAEEADKLSNLHSQSTTNLAKMSSHSKSTTSLGVTGRKKKAAPPPPTSIRASNPAINVETPSPVVANQQVLTQKDTPATPEPILAPPYPSPLARNRSKAPPKPTPRKLKDNIHHLNIEEKYTKVSEDLTTFSSTRIKEVETTITSEGITDNDIKESKEKIPSFGPSNSIVTEDIYDRNSVEAIHKYDTEMERVIDQVENIHQIEEELFAAELEDSILEDMPKISTPKVAKVDNGTVVEEVLKEVYLDIIKDKNIMECENPLNITGTECLDKTAANIEIDNHQKEVRDYTEDDKINSSNSLENTVNDLKAHKENETPVSSTVSLESNEISTSNEALDKKLPAVIAMIPKTTKSNDSAMRNNYSSQTHFLIGPNFSEDLDESLNHFKNHYKAPFTSLSIPLRSSDSINELSDLDEDVFVSQRPGNVSFEREQRRKKISVTSLKSFNSIPDIVSGTGLSKWNNMEDLDHVSLASLGPNSKWVVGDSSGPESLASQQALDSLASLNISDVIRHENKCFGSTDSGIAQEAIEKISEPDDDPSISPPPPPLFEEQLEHFIIPSTADNIEKVNEVLPAPEIFAQEAKQPVKPILEVTPPHDIIRSIEESTSYPETIHQDSEISDIDWHYQLPSPPKAFRDSSPVNLNAREDIESHSLTDFKDSVVTSPELFEKLKNIEDTHSEKDTISSDLTSIVSEEEKAPLLNTLSLENLEKRKSLVYNRVLATSLKMTDKDMVDRDIEADTFSSSLTKFESTFCEFQGSSQSKSANETKYVKRSNTTTQTLPNFKISTYDRPKQKIKVFEDDTIRSNMTNINKMNNRLLESETFETSSLTKSYLGRSMENISVRKTSVDNQSSYSNEEKEYMFYKPEKTVQKSVGMNSNAMRSGSFSKDPAWSPMKPVSRSKSHINLNGNRSRDSAKADNISRSNSFYDGLQSLGVMRLIQNKLNTPTSSMENVSPHEKESKYLNKSPSTPKEDLPPKIETAEAEKPPPVPEKVYRYRGPPSINMSTWSERPKVHVAVKEDADYTLGNTNNMSSKLIVNTTNNNVTSNNTVEVKDITHSTSSINVNGYESKEPKSVNISVNGTDNVNNKESRNVVIKIGSQQPKTFDNQRFINHTTAVGYRKPFNNINANQRPHSIAFDSNFDISRVPVVRSVELKKPFKDINNTSVTQIYQNDNYKKEPVSELMNKFSTMNNRNTEAISNRKYLNQNTEEKETKPVFRANSLKPQMTPVVRGFNGSNREHNNNRYSWNASNSYTLPTNKQKEKDEFSTNSHVPFSQSNLRRTESNKMVDRNIYNKEKEERPASLLIDTNSYQSLPSTKQEFIPPPPPSMSKLKPVKRVVEPVATDPRDQLLSAIRNFGGKKGLKAVKT